METTTPQPQIDYRKYLFRAIAVIVILLSFLIVYTCKGVQADMAANDLNDALKDSVQFYKTKEGLSGAKTTVFEAQNSSDFTKLATKDSTILKLQVLVKQYKSELSKRGSAFVINTEGHFEATTATTVKDSTTSPDRTKSPVYASDFKLEDKKGVLWAWGNTLARKDSTTVKVNFRDELTGVIGVEKTGFLGLGRGKAFADIKTANPYNQIKDVRVYSTLPMPRKRFSVGPTIVYGFGENFTLQPIIGIGATWGLIQF